MMVCCKSYFLSELLIPVAIEMRTVPERAAISVEILTARLEVEISGHQGQRQIIPQRYVRFCADQERIRIVERNPAVIINDRRFLEAQGNRGIGQPENIVERVEIVPGRNDHSPAQHKEVVEIGRANV